jgi:hypothetical protein
MPIHAVVIFLGSVIGVIISIFWTVFEFSGKKLYFILALLLVHQNDADLTGSTTLVHGILKDDF